MARPKTKTDIHARVNTELLAALDDLIEQGETRTDLIEEAVRLLIATRHERLADAEKERED